MHCYYTNKEIQNYLISHPEDAEVRFKIIQSEILYDDFLIYIKTLKINKSQVDSSKYRSISKSLNTIYMDIYYSMKDIKTREIDKIIKEFENDTSEIYKINIEQ